MSNFVSGRHFLQTPGPTNLPDRVLRAMHHNAINHRGPEFGAMGREIVAKLRQVEIVTAQGKSIAEAARSMVVSR